MYASFQNAITIESHLWKKFITQFIHYFKKRASTHENGLEPRQDVINLKMDIVGMLEKHMGSGGCSQRPNKRVTQL